MYQYNPLLESENTNTTDTDIVLGATGLTSGLAGKHFLNNSYDDLMGTVTRYHNTSKANVDAIKKSGIKSSFASDPNNITNRVLRDVPMKDKEGLVYLGKKKSIGRSVGYNRGINGLDPAVNFKKNPFKAFMNFGGEDIKIRFNLDDYNKLIKVDNPELRNAKTPKEFYNKVKRVWAPEWDKLNPFMKSNIKSSFEALGKQGTDVIKGDIDAAHIIGSKHYKKATDLKRWLRYVKNHPGRFGKGIAKAGAGVAGIGAGIYTGKKIYDRHKKKQS